MRKALFIALALALSVPSWTQTKISLADQVKPPIVTASTVSFSATPTFDASTANTFKITLTANVTSSTLSNASAGQKIHFIVIENATGGFTFAWPANFKGFDSICTAANAINSQEGVYDGTNLVATGPIKDNCTNGGIVLPEGTGADVPGASGFDNLHADSSTHRLQMNNNNGGWQNIAGVLDKLNVFAGTSSSEIAGVITDETGSGQMCFATGPTLSSPRIATILDANGNPFITVTSTASAVDSITVKNAATANPATVELDATGSDSNINLALVPKGTGNVQACPACTNAGFIAYPQGTDNSTVPTNSILEQAPTAVTAYRITKPGTKPTNNHSTQTYSNATPGVGAWEKVQQMAITTTSYTNATTTFSNVAGTNTLQFSVEANTNYVGTCFILWQGSASTTGPKFQFTGPASPTAFIASMTSQVTTTTEISASVTALSSAMANTGTVTATTNLPAEIQFSLVNGANAGTLTLQAAANGTGTLTIQPGSYCVMQ